MEKLTYYDLRKKDKKYLWDYGIKNGFFDDYFQKMGYLYFNKSTILEVLSVYHTQWKKSLDVAI